MRFGPSMRRNGLAELKELTCTAPWRTTNVNFYVPVLL
jgi:hypothetical protein